jgi:HlyD family secretion protein
MSFQVLLRRIGAPRRLIVFVAPVVVCIVVALTYSRRMNADPSLTAVVHRGALTATLTTNGTLRPIQSITYRSPIAGRDAEIVELVPEGTRVNEGDLLVRLDTTDLERELERFRQDLRQAGLDLLVSEGEFEEAVATVAAVADGEGALSVEEAQTHSQLAQRRTDRLREEYAQLKPLLEKGFMTREELAKTSAQLEEAEQELALALKRTAVVVGMTHPREGKRAALQRDQKASALGHARTRLIEAQARVDLQRLLIEACRISARHAGMVVHEELVTAVPRRKLRIGDRIFSSQGIITIPEVNRMLVEASVSEADVHRVRAGQTAVVYVEAFPDLRLTGTVSRVGTLASSSLYRPLEDKRFDLIVALDPTTADLRPEMTVRADVVVGTRQDVLLLAVTAVFERQGTFVAHVAGRTGFETRRVDLGESNGQLVEIVAGLRENDRVSLVEPPGAQPPPARTPPPASTVIGHALPRH